MISLPRMVKQAEEGHFERILQDVIRNGRPLPLPVRLRLEADTAIAAAGLGLALQRVTELTYRPSEAAITLLRMLLGRRTARGEFGSIAGAAVALAALHATLSQIDALPGASGSGRYLPADLEAEARIAAAAAIHELAQAQNGAVEDGDGAGLIGDEVDSAIVLWQLGFDARFAAAVRFEELMQAVEDRGLRHDRATRALLEPLAARSARRHSVAA